MKKKRDKEAMAQVMEVARMRKERAQTAFQKAMAEYNALADEVARLKDRAQDERAACRHVLDNYVDMAGSDISVYSRFRGEMTSRQLTLVRTIKQMRASADTAHKAREGLDALRSQQIKSEVRHDATQDAHKKLKKKLETHNEMAMMDDLLPKKKKR